MTKNTLSDLNNLLFEQLERLNDEEVGSDGLTSEMERAKAMSDVSKTIIDNAALALEAEKFMDDRLDANRTLPKMLNDK